MQHSATFPPLPRSSRTLSKDSQGCGRARANSWVDCGFAGKNDAPAGSFPQRNNAAPVAARLSNEKATPLASTGDEQPRAASSEVFLVTDSGVTPVRIEESVSCWPYLEDNPAGQCQHRIEGWVWKVRSRSVILSVAVRTKASGLPWIGRRLVAGKRFLTLDFKAREFSFRCYRCSQCRSNSSSSVFDDITSVHVHKLPWAKAFGFAGIQIRTKNTTALICVRTTDAFLTWLHAFRLASNNSLFLPVSACVLDVVERKQNERGGLTPGAPLAKADKVPGCCQGLRSLFRLILQPLFGRRAKKHSQQTALEEPGDKKSRVENTDHCPGRSDSRDAARNTAESVGPASGESKDSGEVLISVTAGEEGKEVVEGSGQAPTTEPPMCQQRSQVCAALQSRRFRDGRKKRRRHRRVPASGLGISVRASDAETSTHDGNDFSECEDQGRRSSRKRGFFSPARRLGVPPPTQPVARFQRRPGRSQRGKHGVRPEKDNADQATEKDTKHASQPLSLLRPLSCLKDEQDYSDVYLTPDDSDTFRTPGEQTEQ